MNGEEKSTDPSPDTSLTNGTVQDKKPHNAPLQHDNDISKGAETLLFLGYMEAEPGQGLCEDDDDDDDVSAVIRAERVIIMEEGEEVTEESQDTQAKEEEVEEEEREEEIEEKEEREKEQEEKGEEEREETEEREEEKDEGGVEEREEEREEEGDEEREEDNAADAENDRERSTEAGEVTEQEEGKLNTHTNLSNEDTKVKIITHTDKKTSADTDTDTDTKPIKDSATQSALKTDLIPDADPAATAAAVEQENAVAETHPQSLSETPGGTVQTPSVSTTLPASALNPNGAQKSLVATSSSTNTAAQFQEIPLGGATVEEEPLLASKVEPLTDAANQAEGAKTKSCQCCSVM